MFFRYFLLGLFVLVNVSCASMGTRYKVPKPDEFTLKNGMKVLLLKDEKLPYFSMQMLINVGGIDDPKGKEGVVNLVAGLLDKGSVKRSATQIANDLGQLGILFSARASDEYTLVSAGGLSTYSKEIFDNFSELVLEPSFKKNEVWRERQQVKAQIKKIPDSPDSLADLGMDRHLYPDHPYGRLSIGNLKSINRIKRKDIIKTYIKYYNPKLATLAIVGDYPANIRQLIEKRFGSWKPRKKKEIEFPKLEPIAGQDLLLVNKAGAKQTQIRFGHYGIKRTNPDFIKLRVASSILGGGFASRLFDVVRVKKGLTYHIGANFYPKAETGPFIINTFTRHDKVKETIDATLETFEKFSKEGVTSEELEQAKGFLKGLFPMAIETPEKLAFNLLLLDYYGVDRKYLDNYISDLEDISVSDLNKVIKKYFHPKNIKIVVMTTESKVRKELVGRKYKKVSFNSLLR